MVTKNKIFSFPARLTSLAPGLEGENLRGFED